VARNLVLYAVHGSVRRAVYSCAADSPDARLKFLVKAGQVLADAERGGHEHPEFVAVRESREADEGGQFVIRARFEELDPLTLDVIRDCEKLADCFVKKAAPLSQAQVAEDAATVAARALSKSLSE
jgi:hypothetical protein